VADPIRPQQPSQARQVAGRERGGDGDALTVAASLAQCGRLRDAISVYRFAISNLPPSAALHNNVANLWLRLGRLDDALREYRAALEIDPGSPAIYSNFLFSLLYKNGIRRSDLLRNHLEWSRRYGNFAPGPHSNRRDPERRLRVGYVSSGFCFHPKYFLIYPLIAAHDRRSLSVFCYSNSPRNDRCTLSFRRAADYWRDIQTISDGDCARLIRRDRIDILVDLDGHFGGNRLRVFAMRPAPVQVSLPGYPYTTGLDAISYRLTDDLLDPPGRTERDYVEELVRVPGAFACYGAPRPCPAVAPSPSLRNGYVTFACFNARQKCSDDLLAEWAAILRAVPRSRLLLHHAYNGQAEVTAEFRRPVVEVMRSQGVSPARIEMTGGLSLQDHLKAYARADVMLDTYPYNGMTTTFESLWMGVPVVTRTGKAPQSRVGGAILARAGLAEYVCATSARYRSAAVRLANDVAKRDELRRSLRKRVRAAFDPEAHARDVEGAFRAIWRRWAGSPTPS
jgi:predicted O-linked N-acetylglucosamine transferase (SPINDLY family)